MDYRTLGRTGVEVSPLCLGAMMFGDWGNTDHDDSVRIIHRALDAGINFIDTADVYSRGESETIVAKALAGGRRDNVVLATKVHGSMGDDPNQFGNSRRWIIREVEASLKRLNTDWIDLYQIHRPEPRRPTSTRRSARSPTSSTRARSATSAPRRSPPRRSSRPSGSRATAAASASSASSRRTRCSSAAVENDVLPTCRRHGMGVIPWSPLAGGWLSGAVAQGPGRRRTRARADRIPGPLRPVDPRQPAQARRGRGSSRSSPSEAGLSLIHLALAFVINHPAVTAAIIGPRTMEHLESQLGAGRRDARPRDPRPHRRDRPARANVNPADSGWQNPDLEPAARRR